MPGISADMLHIISKDTLEKLQELKGQLASNDITEKGYLMTKHELLKADVPANLAPDFHALEQEFADGDITEKGYYKRLAVLLESVANSPTEECFSEYKASLTEVTNSTVETGSTYLETGGYNDGETGGNIDETPNDEDKPGEDKRNGENGGENPIVTHQAGDASPDATEEEVIKIENGDTEEEDSHKKSVRRRFSEMEEKSEENAPEPPKKKSKKSLNKADKPAKSGDGKDRKTEVKGQRTISDMFTRVTPKRKAKEDIEYSENTTGTSVHSPKSSRCDAPSAENHLRPDGSGDAPNGVKEEGTTMDIKSDSIQNDMPKCVVSLIRDVTTNVEVKPKRDVTKCGECRQLLDEVVMFAGDATDAVEEFVMLTDERLSLFTGDEEDMDAADERPQHRITHFTVYDKLGHLCSFDSGLIEKNKELFFSGWVKPVYDENPDIEGGIATKRMGPINSWWCSGFDGGEKTLIGFSTAFADYYLMSPSDLYEPVMATMWEKVFLSKVVTEAVLANPDITYEDLLNNLQTLVPPLGVPPVTEDALLRHSQWVVDQIESYDEAGDEDEDQQLVTTRCVRDLIKLAGVTLGKRRAMRREARAAKPAVKKPAFTMATTTPLVASIMDSMFREQLDDKGRGCVRKKRCGACEFCLAPDCGECRACLNMAKYGGDGKTKQACLQRRCPNMAVMEADENDPEEELDENIALEENKPKETGNRKSKKLLDGQTTLLSGKKVEAVWADVLAKEDGVTYYSAVTVTGLTLAPGDSVMIKPDGPSLPPYVGHVMSLFESRGDKLMHVAWYQRSTDTVLGEAADPLELLLIDDCEDISLARVVGKVTVIFKGPMEDWCNAGGSSDIDFDVVVKEDDGATFFYQQWYDLDLWRFEDPPVVPEPEEDQHKHCPCCVRIQAKEARDDPQLGEVIEKLSGKNVIASVALKGHVYRPGDCAYFNTEAWDVPVIPDQTERVKHHKGREKDDEVYPEEYRKSSNIKGSNADSSGPFRIGRLVSITAPVGVGQELKRSDIKMKVKKFYRPENTHKGDGASWNGDLHQLFWTEDEATVTLSKAEGRCRVEYGEDLPTGTKEYFNAGPNRFYFNQMYVPSKETFEDPPEEVLSSFRKGKSKGKGKGKGKGKSKVIEAEEDDEEMEFTPLRCLDIFAGCGGLSEGFHQAGIAESRWAMEIYEPAAKAFKLNNPHCTVLSDDCNTLLKDVMEGKTTNHLGQSLPQKGDIDFMCGGPPCQGFSGMNRFNAREYSKFKNSLIASYISYCDYYRPRFFLLENVRNFVSYKNGMVLKLALRCLTRIGYQCAFGVLQAGNYGVPQTRRRAIIIAAAPGEKLPFYPEPLHNFSPKGMHLSVTIDDKKFEGCVSRLTSAPLRTITVRDSMSDLPEIRNGAKKEEMAYAGEPLSHFQYNIRGRQSTPVLRDHVCKDMSALVHARMQHIPTAPGSDWRSLPNKVVRLSDGSSCKQLVYTHNDEKNGLSPSGYLRGVCQCAESGCKCDPADRQFNTLIPWCLPHTGNRHNNWAGLYGRLEWSGFFSTTVTNPEPMGKQGRVLHPDQHRVVSVRECARSQGFPDTYHFYGTILDRHRQVGNAVPPPLARAIGYEIRKSLIHKEKEVAA